MEKDNIEHKNWIVDYLDCNDEVCHTDTYENLTKEQVWFAAEHNYSDRIVEDFRITEKLN